jgi:hypothetical protein
MPGRHIRDVEEQHQLFLTFLCHTEGSGQLNAAVRFKKRKNPVPFEWKAA